MQKEKPLLFLLPGLDGTGKLLNLPANYLADLYETKILAYPHDIKLKYQELADYIENLLPTDKPYYLLAESFGGPLAIELAVRHPKQVLGLILSATFISSPVYLSFLLNPVTELLPIQHIPQLLSDYIFLGNHGTPDLKKLLNETLVTLNNDVINFRIKEVINLQSNEKAYKLTLPILYLQGKYDNIIKAYNYENLKKELPQARKVVINSSHMVLQTEPELCRNAIRDFLILSTKDNQE